MLKCKLFNARSILSKLHIITFVLQSCEYDIILIHVSESWLTAAIPDSFLILNWPYVILRKDRPLGHGGVIVFIKNNLQIVPVNLSLEFQSVEYLLFKLLFSRNLVYCFICIYNPPLCANSLTDTGIQCSLLNHYTSTTNPVFCVGDFNYPNIDWSVPFSAEILTHVKFLSCTLNCGLLQMVHQPTRGLNCLYLVLVSVPSVICNLCVVEAIAVSCDHSTVEFSILFSYMPTKPRLSYPDFAKADYVSITAYLDSIDWLLLQSNCSQVEDFWSEISNIMMMHVYWKVCPYVYL